MRTAVDHIRLSVREDEKKGDGMCDESGADRGRLIQAEMRERGLSSLQTWLLWFKRRGGLPLFMTKFIFMAVDRLAYIAIDFFPGRKSR